MKLHLPKILCMAVMGAIALPTMGADTTYPYVQENEDGSYYMNVGFSPVDGTTDMWIKDYTPTDGTLSVGKNDLIGAFVASEDGTLQKENLHTSFANGMGNSSNVSNTLRVKGDVNISYNGKIQLGGQSHSNVYTGLIANNVTIDSTATGSGEAVGSYYPNANLFATRVYLDTLTVNGGAAVIHADQYGGNSFIGSADGGTSLGALKMAVVNSSIKVTGDGYLSIGRGYNNNFYVTGLGSGFMGGNKAISITQEGGTLKLVGRTLATGGMNVTQDKGVMSIANGYVLSMSGNTSKRNTITQSDKSLVETSLTIGQITGSTTGFDIKQDGAGTINLTNGVTYTSKTASTITQSGGGKINLSGNFSSTVFDITQSKGTINLNNGATMQSNKLALDTNALLNIAGSLTLNEGGTFEIDVNSAHDAAINIGATGSLVATKQALSLSLNEAVVSDMMDTVESATESGLLTYTIDLISSTDISKLNTLSDTLTWKWEGLPQTAALAADTTTTVTSYEYIGSDLVVNQMDDGTYMLQAAITWDVTAEEQIPEPATATLSLLALAGLAARRRRR